MNTISGHIGSIVWLRTQMPRPSVAFLNQCIMKTPDSHLSWVAMSGTMGVVACIKQLAPPRAGVGDVQPMSSALEPLRIMKSYGR